MAAEQSASAVVVAAATGGLLALLPSIADVRAAGPGEEIAHDLRTGLTVGAVFVLALAAAAAFVSKDPRPLIVAGVGITAIVGAYEWVLRTEGLCI